MKILAVDPGEKRLGLAACDELQLTTRFLPVFPRKSLQEVVRKLISLVSEEGFQIVLIGHPLHMDGRAGSQAQRSKELQQLLEKQLKKEGHRCEVLLWDERLTSFEAEQRLKDKGIPKGKAKDFLDSVAAEVLLEDYLRTLQSSRRGG